jgi:hypothetical protein
MSLMIIGGWATKELDMRFGKSAVTLHVSICRHFGNNVGAYFLFFASKINLFFYLSHLFLDSLFVFFEEK